MTMSAAFADALDAERALALHYAPLARREALDAAWRLDARLRTMFATAREPALVEIKLAWWEERLGALGAGTTPAEPLLRRLAGSIEAGAFAASDLRALASAWRELIGEDPWTRDMLAAYAGDRGRALARLSGGGGCPDERLLLAAEGYALFDLADIAGEEVRTRVVEEARARFEQAGRARWPRPLRPLGMLVELARRDTRTGLPPRHGSPARVARMAWYAMTGR